MACKPDERQLPGSESLRDSGVTPKWKRLLHSGTAAWHVDEAWKAGMFRFTRVFFGFHGHMDTNIVLDLHNMAGTLL